MDKEALKNAAMYLDIARQHLAKAGCIIADDVQDCMTELKLQLEELPDAPKPTLAERLRRPTFRDGGTIPLAAQPYQKRAV